MYSVCSSGLTCSCFGYFELSSGRRSAGIVSVLATQSDWPFSTCVTSAWTLRPKRCSMTSGRPAGCASFDHSLKKGLRSTFIAVVGLYSVHLYGPVPGGGMSTCLVGVSAGRMKANGSASCWRNSGSPFERWNVTWLPLTTIPFDRSQLFGVLTHASPPAMTLYHVPAFGLSPILNRRSKVAFTSAPVTVLPFENLIPSRRVNVYVLPLSVGVGTSVARSATIFVPSAPAVSGGLFAVEVDNDPPPLPLVVFDEPPQAATSAAIATTIAASKVER